MKRNNWDIIVVYVSLMVGAITMAILTIKLILDILN
jgi:hypothetical protein